MKRGDNLSKSFACSSVLMRSFWLIYYYLVIHNHAQDRRYYHMKQPRMISVISFPRNNSISPEEVTYIEPADASDISPEKFIASILEDIMNKEIREEEAV